MPAERYYPAIEKEEIGWQFITKKISPLVRKRAGRTQQAKSALKRIEEALRDRQATRTKRTV